MPLEDTQKGYFPTGRNSVQYFLYAVKSGGFRYAKLVLYETPATIQPVPVRYAIQRIKVFVQMYDSLARLVAPIVNLIV